MAFLIQHWPHVKFSETSVLSKANFIFILQFTVLTNMITQTKNTKIEMHLFAEEAISN